MEESRWGLAARTTYDGVLCWGARSILEPDGSISLVPGRHGIYGPTEAQAAFVEKLNAALPKLRQEVRDQLRKRLIRPTESWDVTIDVKGIRFIINTNASCGYLYIVAFEVLP